LKPFPVFLFFSAVVLATAAAGIAASPAQGSNSVAEQAAQKRVVIAPANLQVLPKDLTEGQVRAIMEDWAAALGTDCSTCHVRDPKNLAPNGRPQFDYADDSKQEKKTARVMYRMTQDINAKFLSKVPNSGLPVSCGTCHRGHLGPEPFMGADENQTPHKDAQPTGTDTAPSH
jgi:hypothetical protein